MNWLVATVALCVLVPSAHCASNAFAWCYHLPRCNSSTWATIVPKYCNGTRQSPINIESASAEPNDNLTAFTFNNFSSTSALKKIENTGKTVKVTLDSGVSISGGDLGEQYDSLQFHLHWGNGTSAPGSEHTVDGKRYDMELHIVNIKSKFNGNTTLAIEDSEGAAALGFFIQKMPGNATGQPESWRKLTSYLSQIPYSGNSTSITPGISLNDLLAGVDRNMYYRYHGSLTTPACNEIVVWTVFKDPIKVSGDLINLFRKTVRVGNSSSSPYMVDVYRDIQPKQKVLTQPRATNSATSTKGCSVALMSLGLVLGRV